MDLSAAKPVDLLNGGRARDINIRVAKIRTHRVAGTVLSEIKDGSAPQPAAKSRVLLLPRTAGSESNLTRWVNSNDDGQFEFRGVFPGSYYLVAIATGNPAQLTARKPVEIRDSDLMNQSITAARGFDISGSIRFPGLAAGPTAGLLAARHQSGRRCHCAHRSKLQGIPIHTSNCDDRTFIQWPVQSARYCSGGLSHHRIVESATRDGCKTSTGSEGGIYVVGTDWTCRCLEQRIARGWQARRRASSGSRDKFRIDIRARAG